MISRRCMPFVALCLAVGVVGLAGCGSRRSRTDELQVGAAVCPPQTERRAAFDLGSGTMKLRVSDVLVTSGGAETALEVTGGYERIRVDFEADLNDSRDGAFSEKIMAEGLVAARELKRRAEAVGASSFGGVCTGAFRQARNGRLYAARLSRELGARVIVATPEEEARLGFLAAIDAGDYSPDRILVWDVGGSGQSLTCLDPDGRALTYVGTLGSVVVRDAVIRTIQGHGAQVKTPNPMSTSDVDAVLHLVEDAMKAGVPAELAARVRVPGAQVVGVGPVHFHSVRAQLGGADAYSDADVERALRARVGKTDAQIGGLFADTDVVNLALILGSMRALGLDRVEVINVNNADGLLVDQSFWQKAALTLSK